MIQGPIRAWLERLHEERRLDLPQEKNRNHLSVVAAGLVLSALVVFFLGAVHYEADAPSYLASRARVTNLDYAQLDWQISPLVDKSCGDPESCRQVALGSLFTSSFAPLATTTSTAKTPQIVLARFPLSRATLGGLAEFMTVTVSLPGFQYHRADVFLGGVRQSTHFLNRRLAFVLEPTTIPEAPTTAWLEILLEIPPTQTAPLWRDVKEPAFAATQHEYETFLAWLAAEKAGKGNWIAIVSRVSLAVFVLLLFLIVDGSPESLGLGLAMGFEALYLVTRNRWIAIDLFGDRWDLAVHQYCLAMSSVFQVYFFCQLSRLAKKTLRPWLLGGSFFAALMGLYAYWMANKQVSANAFENPWLIARLSMTLVCLGAAGLGLWGIRGKNVPWRMLALGIGAMAATALALEAMLPFFPKAGLPEALVLILKSAAPNAPYMLALSTFVNISTLENRVRSLSAAQLRSRELEREMTIGREVQESLHRIPALPPSLALAHHAEAAAYVSGDTYFVSWNERTKRLTAILNDVTGHGIPAALKASAMGSMALAFCDAADAVDAPVAAVAGPQFDRYFTTVQAYYDRHADVPDQAAIAAAELDLERGTLSCYRANYLAPYIVEPRAADATSIDLWVLRQVVLQHRQAVTRALLPGSFVLLVSDGLVSDAAVAREFVREMRGALGRRGAELDAESLKAIILTLPCITSRPINDDRTLVVVQWRKTEGAATSARPDRASQEASERRHGRRA